MTEQPEQPEADEQELAEAEQPEPAEPEQPEPEPEPEQPEGDTFPREYVERLRTESAGHRREARDARQRAESLAERVWRLRVAALGVLADPEDLPMTDPADVDLPDDDLEAMAAALLERKPHLTARRARGGLGQAEQPSPAAPSLAALLRAGA